MTKFSFKNTTDKVMKIKVNNEIHRLAPNYEMEFLASDISDILGNLKNSEYNMELIELED